ncbi:hypothetical protein IEQ34_010192 [Dendrobium chrysotoxum]|uniref:Uncharacterized protein n=1 Tax=Dendrobium chrysotoxum TaxID=161865 RepID=A0AAV7H441_DENCH|nr:hypothetical protein IEQ34_010192 [Dendrobium chrysotoxum]
MHRQLVDLKQKIAKFETENEELSTANGSKPIFDVQKEKELESQLEATQLKINKLNKKASFLERNCEKAVSVKLESKFKEMEIWRSLIESPRKWKLKLKSANREVNELNIKFHTLEVKLTKKKHSLLSLQLTWKI